MNDRTRITWVIGGIVAALALALIAAAAPAYAGTWLQQYGKTSECLEGWGSSWAAWAEPVTGGWVCTREVDDPSQPDAGHPVAAPTWVRFISLSLLAGDTIAGPVAGMCPGGADPQDARAVPATDIVVTFDDMPPVGIFAENIGTQTRTFDLQLLCP